MVILPNFPRSKEKDVGETVMLMAQAIKGQDGHMHSNPSAEGENEPAQGTTWVSSKINKEANPVRQGTVSLSLLR